MQYNLLENGADSLRSAYDKIEKFESMGDQTFHNLKESIIFLNHSAEILLKFILKNHSPSLMFTNIESYLKAKEKLKHSDKKTVFDVDQNLKTVNILEALKRIEFLCDIEIEESFKDIVLYINKLRNNIMHFELDMDNDELFDLMGKLRVCYNKSLEFFSNHIVNLEKLIQDIRFEIPLEEYLDDQAEIQGMMAYEQAKEDHYADMMDQMMDNEIQNGR